MTKGKLLAVLILAGSSALIGCTGTAKTPAGQAAMPAAGPVLSLQTPADWKCTREGDKVKIAIEHSNDILIRPVLGTPADAVAGIPAAIHDEVHDFKVTASKDITLAGKPAKHVIGTGEEADDGDPSNTEVFLFTVGNTTYLACVHGEHDAAASIRAAVIQTLDSAKVR
ncbi:MAG: hypothetical protein WCI73_03925 [Phycisphaerae bacterium]